MGEFKSYIESIFKREADRHNNKYEINPLFNNGYKDCSFREKMRNSTTIKINGFNGVFDSVILVDRLAKKAFDSQMIKNIRLDLNDSRLRGIYVYFDSFDTQYNLETYTPKNNPSIPIYNMIIVVTYDIIYETSITQFSIPSGRFLCQSHNIIDIYRQPKRCLFYLLYNNIDIYEEDETYEPNKKQRTD